MEYQVGGSLVNQATSYVDRVADSKLYTALKRGEFCYVLNSRQMGKSSLLVRTKNRLEQEGFVCTTIDMTNIGSENITPIQWYKGIITALWSKFDLVGKLHLKSWWTQQDDISLVQKLGLFLDELVLVHFPKENLVIFVDEIDTILGLEFRVDDFFALIRSYYNKRATNPEFKRLTFAVFGVATPSDLIQDKNRTPFNIGQAIELHGFSFREAQGLAQGLVIKQTDRQAILKAIINWTGGQPFLTQKLCKLINNLAVKQANTGITIPPGAEEFWIENIVKSLVIDKWEFQDEPEHLRTIRDRLMFNPNRIGRLLGIYQQILQSTGSENIAPVLVDGSVEQIELILSGLVVKQKGILRVKNKIYQQVFSHEWVEKQLEQLRPYSQTFEAWRASGQKDTSRLLRGQALIDAQNWARGKSLSDRDYQFLAASEESDRVEVQQALEIAKLKEVEARLAQEKKAAQRQRILLMSVSIALAIATGLGVATFWQYREAKLREIDAIALSSEALFASNQKLAALVQAIKAKRRQQKLNVIPTTTATTLAKVLRQAVYETVESNRLSGHQSSALGVNFSPDGNLIVTASADSTLKIWRSNGALVSTLKGHTSTVFKAKFSPDSKLIASASTDGTIKLWKIDGTELKTFKGHQGAVWDVAFSPDGSTIASASSDTTMKLWKLNGTELRTFKGYKAPVWSVAFSPDGKSIVSSCIDGTIKLWQINGKELKSFQPFKTGVWSVAFSPDGKTFVSGNEDKTVRLWKLDGTELKTFHGHTAAINNVAISPDGQTIASASSDNTIKLWRTDGTQLRTLKGHTAGVWGVAFSPDSQTIASASGDRMVKLWQPNAAFLKPLHGSIATIWGVRFSPDGRLVSVASGDGAFRIWKTDGTLLKTITGQESGFVGTNFSPDNQIVAASLGNGTVQLWKLDGTLFKTLSKHNSTVWDVDFSPNGQLLASGSDDNTIKLWKLDGTLLKTFKGHTSRVYRVNFSPDGKKIASASGDGTVKIWNLDGTLLLNIRAHLSGVWGVTFSPDGQVIASAGTDDTVKLWQLDGTLLLNLKGDGAGFSRVSFSPDGKLIAAAGFANGIWLWKRDGTFVTTLSGHTSTIWDLDFSPDGQSIVTGSDDQTAILWDVQRILNLDLITYGCDWVQNYLQTNAEVEESDRHLCAK